MLTLFITNNFLLAKCRDPQWPVIIL